MISLKTNTAALMGINQLKKSQQTLSQSIERLSSGLRINSAKDDAAGLAIANRMEANLRADAQVTRGINDGISLTQTAEGGLDEINELLHRSRQLAVQAANGTLSDADRTTIHNEFVELRKEIDHISRSTEIFGKYPLAPARDNPPEPQKMGEIPSMGEVFPSKGIVDKQFNSGIVPITYIPAGAKNVFIKIYDHGANDDIQLFTTSGKHLVGTALDKNNTWTTEKVEDSSQMETKVFTEKNGFAPNAHYDRSDLLAEEMVLDAQGQITPHTSSWGGMSFTYSGDGNYNNSRNNLMESLHIDEVTEDLILLVVGSGVFTVKEVGWDGDMNPPMVTPPPNPPPNSEAIDIVMSANYGQGINTLTIDPTPADSKSLGIHETALDPIEAAREALAKLEKALNKVDHYRGQYGTTHNRFESAIDNLAQKQVNTAAAQSRIQDADYAVEVSNMTRAQILQQAGTSVLAQANQVPQTVLSLLG